MKADFLNHLHALPQPPDGRYLIGTPFIRALSHGSMSVELFAPSTSGIGRDIQQPHTQDELYVVQCGTSSFWLDGQRLEVQTGDVLFVSAGKEHHFDHFSQDFASWVVFYGPQGGEKT